MLRPRHFNPGDPVSDFTADDYNAIAAAIRKLANLRAVAPLTLAEFSSGRVLGLDRPEPLLATLSGSSSPYSWKEAILQPDGSWVDGYAEGTSSAYECNGVGGLDGHRVLLRWQPGGNLAFQFIRMGSAPCAPGTAQICVLVTDDGCGAPLAGAAITVKDSSGATIGTCTTVSQVHAVALGSGGTGYTNGTGYALGFSGGGGSGASGTFDVVGGVVANIQLTSGGSGYTSAPAVSFSAAGSGSGASATASVAALCCVAIAQTGTYTVTSDLPGTSTLTQTINAACTLTGNTVTFTYPANSVGTLCVQCQTCDATTTRTVGGASVSITGAGTASATTGADGTVCVRLGAGAYSVAITFPSGFSHTFSTGVSGCGTTSLYLLTTTAVAGTFRMPGDPFDGHCGCTGTFEFRVNGTGTVLGSCPIAATTPDGSGNCNGSFNATITETWVAVGTNYDLVFTFSKGTFSILNQPIQCSPWSISVGGPGC